MIMQKMLCAVGALALTAWTLGGSVFVSSSAMAAASSTTESSVDCSKKINQRKTECFCKLDANKNDPKCVGEQSKLNDNQRYQAAYWLAQNGEYKAAISQLKLAKNQQDPRILNYLGYATRKLGQVEKAMTYYNKALAVNPDYTLARAYMGEAFLEQGKPELAREQLAEIEKRCGTSCFEFAELNGQIKSFEATGIFKRQS